VNGQGRPHGVFLGLLTALWLCLALSVLFSFEYGVPEVNDAGVGISLIPRFGFQRGDDFVATWLILGEDEWGGMPVFLRDMAVDVWLPAFSALAFVYWFERLQPRFGKAARLLVLSTALLSCLPGYFVQEYANYLLDVFALNIEWPPADGITIVNAPSELPREAIACTRPWLERSNAIEDVAPLALFVACGVLAIEAVRWLGRNVQRRLAALG
jgi:hypothetical protein